MSLPYAVVIAGGEGQRLGGVRKADLRIGGMRQLDRVVAALVEVARPIMVSTGPNARPFDLPAGCVPVPDLEAPCAGPLAGLAAAIAHLAGEGIVEGALLTVAVDTPFLPRDFTQTMRVALEAAPASFAAWGEDFYPPNAMWRIESLQTLPREVASDTAPASLKALQRALNARRVDWAEAHASNPFRNINTVADLVALQRIAKA